MTITHLLIPRLPRPGSFVHGRRLGGAEQAYTRPGVVPAQGNRPRGREVVSPASPRRCRRSPPTARPTSFKLRSGLKFSDGSPLKASDFKASIERIMKMDSQGVGLGFTNIMGAEELLESKKGGVDGIIVNDATGEIRSSSMSRAARSPTSWRSRSPAWCPSLPPRPRTRRRTRRRAPAATRSRTSKVTASYSLVKNTNFSAGTQGHGHRRRQDGPHRA